MKLFIVAVTFAVFIISCPAQQTVNPPDIFVKSWATGNEIRERVMNFHLGPSHGEHKEFIRDYGAGRYWLILRRVEPGKEDFSLEYWAVQLREVLSAENSKKEKLGCNLLSARGCGIGDSFFREDQIGLLYPREDPKTAQDKVFTRAWYPASARRVIKVRDFYVIIQIKNYKMNKVNPKKVDSMNVTVEFTNKTPVSES